MIDKTEHKVLRSLTHIRALVQNLKEPSGLKTFSCYYYTVSISFYYTHLNISMLSKIN